MSRNEIIEAVKNYIKDEKAKYVLMIDGAWGSGKTFLYENYLADEIADIEKGKGKAYKKAIVYISLYGVTTIEDVSKQLVASYLLCVKGCSNQSTVKKMKKISGMLGIVSKVLSFSFENVSFDTEGISDDLLKLIDSKDMIICFDDLERCSISISSILGYLNNLVEHCNCKVIVLADEDNIGKMYANDNLEQKYQTILTGDRQVIIGEHDEEDNKTKPENTISIDELKKWNELLYSDNFVYHDIKEKVIGQTLFFNPELKSVLEDLINGTDKQESCVKDVDYKNHLVDKFNLITSSFEETETKNIRIIIFWINVYKLIYQKTFKNMKVSKYYETIVDYFLRYSIWYVVSDRRNLPLRKSDNYGDSDYAYIEAYGYVRCFSFIDRYISTGILADEDLVAAARKIETECELEEKRKEYKRTSIGKSLSELYNWIYMKDDEVNTLINKMIEELKGGEYIYEDYSRILLHLIQFNEIGLCEQDLDSIKEIMISVINKDETVEKERDIPMFFQNDDERDIFNTIYSEVSEKRKLRNDKLEKKTMLEENIYEDSSTFLEYCQKMTDYYCGCRTFMNYVDDKKIVKLIKSCDQKGLYDIRDSFKAIYYMGNAGDFYANDKNSLLKLKEEILKLKNNSKDSITMTYALDKLIESIKSILNRLGVAE